MKRRQFLERARLAAGSFFMPRLAFAEAEPDRKPNIVTILVDDLGYGDLSCYGATDLKTPHIDALAASGMQFSRFYANCPVCSPTRASLLTGRYPDSVGVPGVIRTHPQNSFGYLSANATLVPTVLKRAGYHTAIVGKWHLGLESPNTPTERGFDHFHGFLGDMMDDYYNHRRHGINYMRLGNKEIDPEGHATDLFTQWAGDYIRSRSGAAQPFYLYLAYNAPHTPIQPPAEWLDRVKAREPGMDDKRAKLVALIEHLDDGVGKVVASLKESGAYDNTLVVFVSDNGGQLDIGASNGDLRGAKCDMYEGGIRVPMCAGWPGRIAPGSHSDCVALTMDLFPTVCEGAGAEFSHEVDGRSFLPTLLGNVQPPEERLLFWMRRDGGPHAGLAYYAVRHGDWKLLQDGPDQPLQLFHLKSDPREERPVKDKPQVFALLRAALPNHVIQAGAAPWQKESVTLPPIEWGDAPD